MIKPGLRALDPSQVDPRWNWLWPMYIALPLNEGAGLPNEYGGHVDRPTYPFNPPTWHQGSFGPLLRIGQGGNRFVDLGPPNRFFATQQYAPWTACALVRWQDTTNDEGTFFSQFGVPSSRQLMWQFANLNGTTRLDVAWDNSVSQGELVIEEDRWYLAFLVVGVDGDPAVWRKVVIDMVTRSVIEDTGAVASPAVSDDLGVSGNNIMLGRDSSGSGGDSNTSDLSLFFVTKKVMSLPQMTALAGDPFGPFRPAPRRFTRVPARYAHRGWSR